MSTIQNCYHCKCSVKSKIMVGVHVLLDDSHNPLDISFSIISKDTCNNSQSNAPLQIVKLCANFKLAKIQCCGCDFYL